jgi:hypothetical protein
VSAESFYCQWQGETLAEAFNAAREDAFYWHGHAGYTGTICEKDDVVAYRNTPNLTFEEADDIFVALEMSWNNTPDIVIARFGEEVASEIVSNFNDKYGPAVAFYLGDNRWYFCGMASS